MHKLGRGDRDKVQQFMAITGTSVKFALRALQESVWNLDGAVDHFYEQPQIRYIPDQRHIGELYQRYRDPFTDTIMADGISSLCKDLQVHPEDSAMGQKSLALETAKAMWEILFAERPWPLIYEWCEFLEARHNKAISKDTWSQLLVFAKMVDPSLSNYDAKGPYPHLIDEFVECLGENGLLNRSS